ncbi:MAG: nitrite reductase small subunit NirD [Rubrobacter sp.]
MTTSDPKNSGEWKKVCMAEDVPLLEGRRVVVDGFYIALFNTEEGFYATVDVCPHLGGPLSDGEIAATTVSCPLHGRKIELTTGEVTNDDLSRVATFPVKVKDEHVMLDVSALSSRIVGKKRCTARDADGDDDNDEQREEVA